MASTKNSLDTIESSQDTPDSALSKILSIHSFECFSPPPLNSVRGAVVPRVLEFRKRRRKISIEVHLVSNFAIKQGEPACHEECIVRVLDSVENNSILGKSKLISATEGKNDFVDDVSTSPGFLDKDSALFVTPDDVGWKSKYRFPISCLNIKGTHKSSVMVELTIDRSKEVRELIFDSPEESERFQATVKRELSLECIRAEKKISAALGDNKIEASNEITFLFEIVSGRNLPVGDFMSSDPYVRCFLNGKEVHRTKYTMWLNEEVDPIWTLNTGSLFLLSLNLKELFLSNGLTLIVYDYDSLGSDEQLGTVTFTPKQIHDAKGEREELKLLPPQNKTGEVPGHIALRCRRATGHDIHFMREFSRPDKKADILGMNKLHKAVDSKGGAGSIAAVLTRKTRIAKNGRNTGKKEYKIRPSPDPSRPDETDWMSYDEIQEECMKDSINWIEMGSGRFGRLFVEIIGCDGLPNMDTGGFAGNKTDSFISMVYEDTLARTDIIDDCLSPRFMPWTKRAFIFHMFHSSSDLFIGVFDHDSHINPADDHDFIGRVAVDISNLRKDTTYTLRYDLYTTSRMANLSERRSYRNRMGTITLRLRMEIEDERKLVLSNLEPPPLMYVNVKSRRDYRVIRSTCIGKYDMDKYNMDYINSYIDELLALRHVLLLLQDALILLLLWRGTYEVKIGKKTVFIPIHSMATFAVTTTVVEIPQLVPAVFFASIAWILLASMDYRRQHPNAWSRCKSFQELFQVLVFGSSQVPPDSIRVKENYEQTEAFYEYWQQRIKSVEEEAMKKYEESIKSQKEYEREMDQVGEQSTDITTKNSKNKGITIDPLEIVLYPLQQQLGMVVKYFRYVKYVVTWQECYFSFWITLGCFMLSLICCFVPWFFIIKWLSRLLVWVTLGPWMKLVDIYYIRKIKPLTAEERENKKKILLEKRLVEKKAVFKQARIRRENASKLKDMKKHLFGKYILGVPILKEDRFIDVPLPESFAVPYQPERQHLSELAMRDAGYHKIRIPGQHLVGDMIPQIASHGLTDAPVGQATSQPALVDREGPGGIVISGKDSNTAAYTKIGSLIVASAVLTWIGVPILASITERSLKWTLNQYT